MNKIKGIGASNGISTAKAFILIDNKPVITKKNITDISLEIKKYDDSVKLASKQIEKLKSGALKKLGEEKAAVFDAHLGILNDPEMEKQVKEKITNEKINASFALHEVANFFKSMFSSMEDAYMKERAADICDVTDRLLKLLEGIEIKDLTLINEEVIIIAHDLTPSETSQLNEKYVKGFITEIGGKTSHSAIMARTLEIPAIVGCGKNIFKIKEGSSLLIDGGLGEIVVNPEESLIKEFNERAEKLDKAKKEQATFKNKKSVSKDG